MNRMINTQWLCTVTTMQPVRFAALLEQDVPEFVLSVYSAENFQLTDFQKSKGIREIYSIEMRGC